MRTSSRRWTLAGLSGLYACSALAGLRLAMRDHETASFLWIRPDGPVLRDFVVGWGSAMTPPLALMGAQALATAFVLRSDDHRQRALTALTALAAMYVVGQAGERITWRVLRPSSFEPAKAAVVTANVAIPAAMVAVGMRELRASR